MSDKRYRIVVVLALLYLAGLSLYLLWHGGWFSPDQFFLAALLLTIALGKWKQFLRDWSLPVVLLLSYEGLRGVVPILAERAHFQPMIAFDQAFFGQVPSVILQHALATQNVVHWYDIAAVLLYLSHFVVPLVVAFILWMQSRRAFRDYALSLVLLSYMGFLTYVLFPAAPPWLASQNGLIPPLLDIQSYVSSSLGSPVSIPTIFAMFGANPVAAVPSLHAAFPMVSWMFGARYVRRAEWLLAPYTFGIWFSVMYLGHHYFFDIVTGVLYAAVAIVVVTRGGQIVSALRDRVRPRDIQESAP